MADNGVRAEQPTVLHITHPKSGSQWAYQVLAAAAPGRVVRALVRGEHFSEPIITGMVYPTVYETREGVERVHIPGPQLRVFVMRDLRDTLVSLYFGFRHSHRHLNHPDTAAHIDALQDVSFEEGMRREMRVPLRWIAAIQTSWMGTGVPVVRYEELVADEVEAFGRFLGHCGLRVGEAQLRGLLAPASFEARGGRPRGVEDLSSHNRKGIVGDWRNHLSGELLDEFKALYDDVMVETGYEANRDWGASPAAVTDGRRRRRWLRGGSCWCGSRRLRPYGRGFDRCSRCGTLVRDADAPVGERVDGDRLWTDFRFDHNLSRPPRAWRGAPVERPEDVWHAATLERLDLLLRWARPGGRVLEAAAGTGALAALLAGAGFDVTALETSEAAAEHGRRTWGVDVRVGDLRDERGPFDAIVLVDVLGRVDDPLGLVRACVERLGPDGVLLVDQPVRDGNRRYEELRRIGSLELGLLRGDEFAYVFSGSSLDRLIAAGGLQTLHGAGTVRVAGRGARDAAAGAPSGVALLEALLGQRRLLDMTLARWQDERRLVVAQQQALLEARDPRLVTDRLGFGAGWHDLEQYRGGEAFRWAGEDAELTIANPSGRGAALLLDIEPGAGIGGRDYELELLDADGARLDRVSGPRGRAQVRLACPIGAGQATSVRLRASPGGLPTPGGDNRILNFRLFSLGWE